MLELMRKLGRYPRFCVWELTLACNLRCKHCGSLAGTPRADELELGRCLDVADQMANLGCEKVTLGGGEPTLWSGWDRLAAQLTVRGVRVNMISNGWRFTAEDAARARDAGLANVAFSLDGLEAAHDHVRRTGSFGRVLAAVERCAAAGLPASVITHINQRNRDDLPRMRPLLAALGVSSWQLQTGTPTGELHAHDELVLAPSDLLWLVPLLAELRADRSADPYVVVADNIGYYGRHEPALREERGTIPFWIGCRAGWQVIGIESDGTIKGCLSLPSRRHGHGGFVEGSVRDQPLAAIWDREGAFAYNRVFDPARLAGFCAVCRYRDICRAGCSWTAHAHSGNRHDNPFCFYRQAVLAGRHDLLADELPTEAELAHVGRG